MQTSKGPLNLCRLLAQRGSLERLPTKAHASGCVLVDYARDGEAPALLEGPDGSGSARAVDAVDRTSTASATLDFLDLLPLAVQAELGGPNEGLGAQGWGRGAEGR